MTGYFLCDDGTSIIDSWRCDGVADCSGGEDESAAAGCAGMCYEQGSGGVNIARKTIVLAM